VRVNELRTRLLVCIWLCRCEGFAVAGRDWVKDYFGRGVQIDGTPAQFPAFIPLAALPEFPSDSH
jgi:hypothetical protein